MIVAMVMTTSVIGLLAFVGLRNLPQRQSNAPDNMAKGDATLEAVTPNPVEANPPLDRAIVEAATNRQEESRLPQPTVINPAVAPQPTAVAETPQGPIRLVSNDVVELIDSQIQRGHQIAKIEPASLISDETWCRRVYQRVLGRTASDEELRRFNRRDGDRRQALLDQLFNDERYRKEYASYWASIWTNQLLSNPGDTKHADSLRAGLRRYLQSAFQQGVAHDQWAAELIAAEGSNSLQADDYNGATNYLLALRDDDGSRIASEVCRVLLGQRVQCAQCHDDQQNKRNQESFWEVVAFFRQFDVEVIRPGKARLIDQDLAGTSGAAAVRFQRQKDGEWQDVFPRFLDPAGATSNGQDSISNRRQEFARLMTDSSMFSEAAVNRIWSHLLAFGFTSPVDDMGRHNPAAHPELLASLAEQFELHDFETPALIRWIVMSEPFNRSQVITAANGKDAPLLGSTAFFSRFYHRPVFFSDPVESLAGLENGEAKLAMLQVPGIDVMLNAQIQRLLNDDKATGSRRGKSKVDSFGEQLSSGHKRLAASLAKSSMSSDKKMEHVFMAILGRQPSSSELKRSLSIYEAAQERNRSRAIETLIWALTRTNEFVSLH